MSALAQSLTQNLIGVSELVALFVRMLYCCAALQRYMLAYDRQGRQASARFSNSHDVLRPRVRSNPTSPVGKASGSPRARMATYCAVQLSIPRISQSRAKKVSASATRSKLIAPSQTARARAQIVSARPAVRPSPSNLASARVSGVGNKWVRSSAPEIGWP